MMSGEKINIGLNSDEALVLFDFLSRFSDTDQLAIHDQAEKMVLWDICCDLEKILPKPFSGCYVELLEAARSKVRDIEE